MTHALRVLEFDQIVERLRARAETALGFGLAADVTPSFDEDEVWMRLEDTAEAYDALAQTSPPSLGAVRDMRQAARRAGKGGLLGGQELFEMGEALAAMRAMRLFVLGRREAMPRMWRIAEGLPNLERLEVALLDSLEPNGDVKDAASSELATLRRQKQKANQRILEKVQSYISGRTRELLSDPIYTVRDGRFVIPLKAENRGKIKGIVHDTSGSGQTLFVEPEDVLQLGNALREVEAAEREEVQRILGMLSSKVGVSAREIADGLEAAGEIDLRFAKARLSFDLKGIRPERMAGHRIEVSGGRHPMLDPKTAVPLDLAIGVGASVLITGPNTGGKTVAIKTIGLFVLMAQAGVFLPALQVRLGPFTQIWADIGDEQSLAQSLSTFSGHIKNIAEALKGMKRGALALLDEVGAGTDPAEGAALAQAVLLEMRAKEAAVLASTHYGELKAFAYETEGFQNAAMEFDNKTLQPTYKLRLGAPGASQALRIAERYGIPSEVIQKAREGLSTQHQDMASMMEQLESAQRRARAAQSEADKRSAELKRAEAIAERKLAEADEVRRNAFAKADAKVEEALRDIRLEAARLFEEIKRAPHDASAVERARRDLKALQDVGSEVAQKFKRSPKVASGPRAPIHKGVTVRIEGYAQTGVVLEEPSGDSALVQVGILKMTIPIEQLTAVAATVDSRKPRTSIGFERAQTATTEIHLRNMSAEDAARDLEKFIDDAMLAGLDRVRIVHGKGGGVLRKITQDYLRRHPGIASFRDGEPPEGGQGVTIAVLK